MKYRLTSLLFQCIFFQINLTYCSNHSYGVEESPREGPESGRVVGAVEAVVHGLDHLLLVLGHHAPHLLVPVALVQRVVLLRDRPQTRNCQGPSLNHGTDTKVLCLEVFKHKCTKYQIAEDEDAYANVAEDEGYNTTEAVLETPPQGLSRWNMCRSWTPGRCRPDRRDVVEQLDPLLGAPQGERVGGVLGDPDLVEVALLVGRQVENARHPEGSILLHGSSSSIYTSSIVATAPSIESGRLAFAQQLESRQAGSSATVAAVTCTELRRLERGSVGQQYTAQGSRHLTLGHRVRHCSDQMTFFGGTCNLMIHLRLLNLATYFSLFAGHLVSHRSPQNLR